MSDLSLLLSTVLEVSTRTIMQDKEPGIEKGMTEVK